MQAVPPRAVGHDAAGELVDEDNLSVVADEVLLVEVEAMVGGERLRYQLFAPPFAGPEAVRAVVVDGDFFEPLLPARGEVDLFDGLVDLEIPAFFELPGQRIGSLVARGVGLIVGR